MKVFVLIPTVNRSHSLAPIANNIQMDDRCTPVFILEEDDHQSHDAAMDIENIQIIINTRSKSYAGAINCAVALNEPIAKPFWYFFGADDLLFHDGWLDQMLDLIPHYEVVGTNDLGNDEVMAGLHSTHSLVSKNYAERGCIDQIGVPFSERYAHNWCDKEFIETAKSRNVFAPCLASVVEHRHWAWRKAQIDATYEKGFRTEAQDRAIYQERLHLWNGI